MDKDQGQIPQARADEKECFVVVGNHASHHGIGDIVATLRGVLARDYRVTISQGVYPGGLNILIDEFSNPFAVEFLKGVKRDYPTTRYLVAATEFVTPIALFGLEFGTTFNFFGDSSDWKRAAQILAADFSLWPRKPYMHVRYQGFLSMLEVTDTLIAFHPKIAASLDALFARATMPRLPCVVIYPEIDLTVGDQLERLRTLPFGFTITGTLTPYRSAVAKQLEDLLREAGYAARAVNAIPFGAMSQNSLMQGDNFSAAVEKVDYLYNLNPPQVARWRFSSPMRIYRAARLGQIPVITMKFNDHEIEQIATHWDGKLGTAKKIACDGTVGRLMLVEKYCTLIHRYNEIAKRKNEAVLAMCKAL